jgi:hypothetical protein
VLRPSTKEEETEERIGALMRISTEQVWEDFHAPLQQFIRRHVSDGSTAEDILQDVFLKIHQRIETLKDVQKLESWLYQITPHIPHFFLGRIGLFSLQLMNVLLLKCSFFGASSMA